MFFAMQLVYKTHNNLSWTLKKNNQDFWPSENFQQILLEVEELLAFYECEILKVGDNQCCVCLQFTCIQSKHHALNEKGFLRVNLIKTFLFHFFFQQ